MVGLSVQLTFDRDREDEVNRGGLRMWVICLCLAYLVWELVQPRLRNRIHYYHTPYSSGIRDYDGN
jgi:hypothetical protein